VLTLEELRGEFAGSPILLLLGADAFRGLPSWHRWREIFDLAHLVVVERPGVNLEADLPAQLLTDWRTRRVTDPAPLFARPAGCIFVQEIAPQPVAATTIREILARGSGSAGTLRGLLPPAVLAYIEHRQLYLRGSDAP
jgi:nicotinate-nucleotide adenylyltransferase